jgi:hypothetical protein
MTDSQNTSMVLEKLAYNFDSFELSGFLNHVQNIHRREIRVFPFPF